MSGPAILLTWLLALSPVPPAVALSGTVRSSDGQPIAGAQVVLLVEMPVVTTTDASGAFSLPDASLPARLEISARGFALERLTVQTSPIEITLLPATVTESVVINASAGIESTITSGSATLLQVDLARLPTVTLDESLTVISGFSLFRRSTSRASNPTTHGVTLRGLSASGASRGLVLFDGVPLNEGFGGWVTWTRLPPLAIGEVTVTKGPQGDAFGSDALGGLVQIEPASVADQIALNVGAGSRGLVDAGASAGRRAGSVGVFGAASWFRSDGDIPVEPASRGPVDRPADVDWVNGLGRINVVIDRHRPTRLTFTAWGGRDDRGNGTELQRNRMRGGTLAADFRSFGRTNTLAARVSYSPNTFDQTFTAVAAGRASERLTSTQATETTTTRALVEGGYVFGPAFVLARGALTRARADFEEIGSAVTERRLRDDSEALSVQVGTSPLGRISLGAGLRHEWRVAPDPGSGDRAGATVGHVRATVELPSAASIVGSVATSHRWPTLNELVRGFRVGSVQTLANADLDPERAVSGEIGATIRRLAWTISATVFRSVVHDAIANVTLQSTPTVLRERQNAGDARATGVELAADGAFGDVRIRGSVTIAEATFANSVETVIEGNRLPQVPRVSGSVWADVPIARGVRATAIWHGLSQQFDDDRNAFALAGASSLDLRIGGTAKAFGWSIAVTNLFDTRLEVGRTPLVTIAPGREVRAAITWRY